MQRAKTLRPVGSVVQFCEVWSERPSTRYFDPTRTTLSVKSTWIEFVNTPGLGGDNVDRYKVQLFVFKNTFTFPFRRLTSSVSVLITHSIDVLNAILLGLVYKALTHSYVGLSRTMYGATVARKATSRIYGVGNGELERPVGALTV